MTKRRMSLRRNQTNLKTERHWRRRQCFSPTLAMADMENPRSFTDWDLRLDMEQRSYMMVNMCVFC